MVSQAGRATAHPVKSKKRRHGNAFNALVEETVEVVDPEVLAFLDHFAQCFSHLAPRYIVELLIAPSWDVGRLIKWAVREALDNP